MPETSFSPSSFLLPPPASPLFTGLPRSLLTPPASYLRPARRPLPPSLFDRRVSVPFHRLTVPPLPVHRAPPATPRHAPPHLCPL